MEHDFRYIGCFVQPEELAEKIAFLGKERLYEPIRHPHVTFRYRPDTVDRDLFGEAVRIRVTGYGNDGRNEGLKVELFTDHRQLGALAQQIAVPHITLSISRDSESVYTRYLDFEPVEPFELVGIFGGFHASGRVVTEKE